MRFGVGVARVEEVPHEVSAGEGRRRAHHDGVALPVDSGQVCVISAGISRHRPEHVTQFHVERCADEPAAPQPAVLGLGHEVFGTDSRLLGRRSVWTDPPVVA